MFFQSTSSKETPMSDTITIIGKGPSAINAQAWIAKAPGTHVCSINDAMKLFTGHVNWCFFSDLAAMELVGSLRPQERVDVFVTPQLDHPDRRAPITRPDWLNGLELIQYPYMRCNGDIVSLSNRITEGGITHHNTTNGAMHWLVKHGKYRRVRLIGIDGGKKYAPGVGPVHQETHELIAAESGDDFLDQWKAVTERLVTVLKKIYAIEVEWYGH